MVVVEGGQSAGSTLNKDRQDGPSIGCTENWGSSETTLEKPAQQIAVCASGAQSDPSTRPKRTLDEALGAAVVDVWAGRYGESGL